jgi:putative ABC transport system permease protein
MRPGRTALSILSVAIAVAAVLGTALAQTSVRQGVRNLSREVGGRPALEIVSLAGGRLVESEVPDTADIPGATAGFSIISRGTIARVHGKRFRAVLVGLPPDDETAWQSVPLVSGRAVEEPGEAILSTELAKTFDVQPGDKLTLLTRRGPRSATVVGFAKSAVLGELAPGASLVMPLVTVQGFFGLAGQVDRVRVFVASSDERERVQEQIAARLPESLVVQAPVGKIEQVDSTLRSTELALRFAGTLSMAMAVFIILNTLRMNFGERRHDVAVLRVLGASARQIVTFHLSEGICMGLLGAAAGVPLGVLLGRGLSGAMQSLLGASVPAPTIPLAAVITALLLGPVVAALAALVPALQSRKVSPREALGDVELRRVERFPVWAAVVALALMGVSSALMLLVVNELVLPRLAIPAGLLLLVGFIAIIPAALSPVVRTTSFLFSPWMRMQGELAVGQLCQRSTRTGLTVGVLVVAIANGLGLGTAIVSNVHDIREWYRRSLAADLFLVDPSASERAAAAQDRRTIHEVVAERPEVSYVIEVRILPIRANGLPGICMVRDFLPQVELPWAVTTDQDTAIRAGFAKGGAVVSTVMAKKLRVGVGDTIRLEMQGRTLSLPVAGLVNDYMLGGLITYVDQATAAKLIELGPAETYMVRAAPNSSTEELAHGLEALATEQGLVVQSLADLRNGLDRLIGSIVGALWGLLAVGFVVGGIAVANTLSMSVLEQTRELGLLRIAGMTRGQLRKLVLCESLFVGILGALTGTVAGIVTAFVIHLCNEPVLGRAIPFSLHGWLVAANVAGCLLVTLVAAWSPGQRAARLDLLAAIAYE